MTTKRVFVDEADAFDDQGSLPPPNPKELAAQQALLQASKVPAKRVEVTKKAASSAVAVEPRVPGMKAGGKVRGCGCAVKGKTKGMMR